MALPSFVSGTFDGLNLSRGPDLVYPFFWVPTHSRRALGAAARGKYLFEFTSLRYHGQTALWWLLVKCLVK